VFVSKQFHHIGLPTTEEQPGSSWVASTRVWVSNPAHHPQRIEWLRYEADSPVDEDFRQNPHIAYTVDDLQEHLADNEVVRGPFEVGEPPFATAAFTQEHGIIVEYMQLYPGRQWFDDEI
jgi:hypothetical protein